jgi:hypothetical protein
VSSLTTASPRRIAARRRGGAGGAGSRRRSGARDLLGRAPAWAITALCGLVYVILAPPSSDLAAAAYRSDLFSRAGFTLWDNGWYGGHHLPAYSVIAPALGAWIGLQVLVAVSMVAATALFAPLIDGLFPSRATRVAALWFAVGASVALLANRVAFDLGLALGLASLLAARHRRHAAALALALLSSLASPAAGAFLALAFLTWALAGRAVATRPSNGRLPNSGPSPPGPITRPLARAARPLALGARPLALGAQPPALRARPPAPGAWPLLLTLASLAPIALLQLAFPEGGTQPFVASAFYPDLAAVLLIAALIACDRRLASAAGWPGGRVLLTGALLYAVALACAYAIPTAVGGNADRLGALLAGPVAACVLLPRRGRLLLVLAPVLLYWQANAPVADFASAASDPAVHASYYAPLVGELQALGVGYAHRPARIEVVPTRDHFEALFVADHVALARGWERQLDTERNALFYEPSVPLTAARYRAWLSEQAISYVALADAPLDYSASAEARLLRGTTGGDQHAGAHGETASGERAAGSGPGGSRYGHPPTYLREVWRSAHWRLFAVLGARPLAQPPAALTALGQDSFTLSAPRPGAYTVRVRFTPYWALSGAGGCLSEAPGGWTELRARRAGSLHVVIRFSLARLLAHGPRCS